MKLQSIVLLLHLCWRCVCAKHQHGTRRRLRRSRPGQVHALRRLSRRRRQQLEPGMAEPRRPARAVHRQAAAGVQERRPPGSADDADGAGAVGRRHRRTSPPTSRRRRRTGSKPTRTRSRWASACIAAVMRREALPRAPPATAPRGDGNPRRALSCDSRPAGRPTSQHQLKRLSRGNTTDGSESDDAQRREHDVGRTDRRRRVLRPGSALSRMLISPGTAA